MSKKIKREPQKTENRVNATTACDIIGVTYRNRFVVLRKFAEKNLTIEEWRKYLKRESLV